MAFKKAVGVWKERQSSLRRLPREMVPEIETPSLHNPGRGFENRIEFFKCVATVKSGLQAVVSEVRLLQVAGHCLRALCYCSDELFGGPCGMIPFPSGDNVSLTVVM